MSDKESWSVGLETVLDILKRGDNTGLCVRCDAEQPGVDPDAEKVQCSACNFLAVYGINKIKRMPISFLLNDKFY